MNNNCCINIYKQCFDNCFCETYDIVTYKVYEEISFSEDYFLNMYNIFSSFIRWITLRETK